MEAEIPAQNVTLKAEQEAVKPAPKRRGKKPKDNSEERVVQFRCGCSKIYVSESKLIKHIEERHSSIFLEVVKYESLKKSTLQYIESRQRKIPELAQSLSKRPPKPAETSGSEDEDSDSDEDQEDEFILGLILQVTKFLDQIREIDAQKSLSQHPKPPVSAQVVFGNPRKPPSGQAFLESKSMMIENFTGQSRAKVVLLMNT